MSSETFVPSQAIALYPFAPKNTDEKSSPRWQLPFEKGELLNVTQKINNEWMKAVNGKGDCGIVPTNFIKIRPSRISASPQPQSQSQTPSQTQSTTSTSTATATTTTSTSTSTTTAASASTATATATSTATATTTESSAMKPDPTATSMSGAAMLRRKSSIALQPSIISIDELAENVRKESGISYDQSVTAVGTVLRYLEENFPASRFSRYFEVIHCDEHNAEKSKESGDQQHLKNLFEQLTIHMNDYQQLNWSTHDDSSLVLEYLEELQLLLEQSKPENCQKMIRSNNYAFPEGLIEYYQKESRQEVRISVMKTLGSMGVLDKKVFSLALSSTLPNELGRDIFALATESEDTKNSEILLFSLVLATMLFSTGEKIPVSVYDIWNQDLMVALLKLFIESDQISDNAFNTLISFNLHYSSDQTSADTTSNLILLALEEQPTSLFNQRLLLLINRGDDPVAIFPMEGDNSNAVPHSTFKMTDDLFRYQTTALSFFTNDLKTLIDILWRELQDLDTGERRYSHLILLELIILNTDWLALNYRLHQVVDVCTNIMNEEEEGVEDRKAEQKDKAQAEKVLQLLSS